ncbi:MAG: hypothetical protein CMF62_04335 [Magnetococcales bacterium]|nr:hypothetical protein [Magnetococcales bacterium]
MSWELRKTQIECKYEIDKLMNDEFDSSYSNRRGLIKMFCGTGKSLIIYDTFLKYGSKLCVIVFPSIPLITQFNESYIHNEKSILYNEIYYKKKFTQLNICSKNELNHINELNFTTNEDNIENFLDNDNDNDKLILITYQSFSKLYNVLDNDDIELNTNIDLIMFDEAHHIIGDKIKSYIFESDYLYDTMLFFTATPKNSNGIYMYELPDEINYDEVDLMNDENTFIDDEPHCGNLIYEYFHIDGVEDNILNDFKIRMDLFTNNKNKCYNSILEAISRSIIESGNTRVLTFHGRSETSSDIYSDVVDFTSIDNKEKFKNIFNNLIKNEYPDKSDYFNKITIKGITGKTKNKQKILKEFDNTKDNDIYILSSCQTIGEGVDTKKANHVVFVDPKQSYTSIIQNIGRVTRKNKNMSTILLPCWVDKTKYEKCKTDKERDNQIRLDLKKGGDFTMITNVLSALRQSDPFLFESCLKYPNKFSKKSIENSFSKIEGKVDWEEKDLECAINNIDSNFKYNITDDQENNLERFSSENKKSLIILNENVDEQLIRYGKMKKKTYLIVKNDKFCNVNFNNCYSKDKLEKPKKRKINLETHTDNELQVLWNITDISENMKACYIESSIIGYDWYEKFDELKKFIDVNKRRPTQISKYKYEKIIGYWLSNQIQNFKKKKEIMKNEKIYCEFKQFIDNYSNYFLSNDKLWYKKLEELKLFIDKNKRRPNGNLKNSEGLIGRWYGTQKINFRNKQDSMKNKEIYNSFFNFKNKYSKYFKSNEQFWNDKFIQLSSFIDKNKKRPSQKSKNFEESMLGYWLSSQIMKKNKKIEIMKNEKIYNNFEKFLEDYSDYFKSNEDLWYENFYKLKKYIDINKKRPTSKNIKEKTLSSFLCKQIKNFKNKIYIMKNEKIYNKFEKFLEDYSDYFKANEDLWYEKLEDVKNFIDVNKRRPKYKEGNHKWLQHQITNFNNKKFLMKNEKIYDVFEKFLEDYSDYFKSNEELWYQNFNNLKNFIDINKRRPNSNSKNKDEKNVGNWKSKQISNFRKKQRTMKNQKIYNEFKKFLEDYSNYFKSNDELWFENFEKLKKFIDINKRRPKKNSKNKDEKNIGIWLIRQYQKFKKK